MAQLSNMGYAYVMIKDEQSLLQNLTQLAASPFFHINFP